MDPWIQIFDFDRLNPNKNIIHTCQNISRIIWIYISIVLFVIIIAVITSYNDKTLYLWILLIILWGIVSCTIHINVSPTLGSYILLWGFIWAGIWLSYDIGYKILSCVVLVLTMSILMYKDPDIFLTGLAYVCIMIITTLWGK